MPNMHTCMYVLFERSSDLITLPSAIPEFQEFVRFFARSKSSSVLMLEGQTAA